MNQRVTAAGHGVDGLARSAQTTIQSLKTIIPTLERLERSVLEAASAVGALEGDIKTSASGLVTEVKQVGADVRQVREATGELVDLAKTQLAASS
jgi:hypothetical protein